MAELHVQKKGKKQDDSGIGSVLDFLLANARVVLGVGGAAMLGIATLAVKRLIDRAASPPEEKEAEEKLEEKSFEETWKEAVLLKASPKFSRKPNRIDLGEAISPPEPSEPVSICTEQREPADELKKLPICFTLQEQLLHYSTHRASASGSQEQLGSHLVLDIMSELQDFLRAKHPHMPFSALQLGGVFGSCLSFSCSDHCCFSLPLALEPDLWQFIPGHETILNDAQFWMVRRTDLEYAARGSSPWDRFMVGGYLSSRTIVESLHRSIMVCINWPAIGAMLDCIIQPVIAPNDLKLEVTHSKLKLIIHILPTVAMGDVMLLAHHHPNAPGENLWQQSFYKEEIRRLQELDDEDGGVRRLCFRILQEICRDNPDLSLLSAAHLRNAILHLSDSTSDWTEPQLADRFLQVIGELIGYLEEGVLPGYFNSRANLFSCLRERDIEELGFGLFQVFSEPESVLKT
uniref:Mitochondrial elongation factor 2 n=1 Tax=Leptobrachium leishanense TaxID=445787 RepID=A0A8C5PQT4_9ANUR